jgi:hypothetical protein
MRVEVQQPPAAHKAGGESGAVLWVERARSRGIVRDLGDAVRNAKAQAEMPA